MNNESKKSASSSFAVPESQSFLKQLWKTIINDPRPGLSVDEDKIADCFGIDFEHVLEHIDQSPCFGEAKLGLRWAASATANRLVTLSSSLAVKLETDHLLALARLLPILEFVQIAGRAPSNLTDLRTVLSQNAALQTDIKTTHVALVFADLAYRNTPCLESSIASSFEHQYIFLKLEAEADDFVGYGEVLYLLGDLDAAKICFKRALNASKPLSALATLRTAQLLESDSVSSRFLAAANVIGISWAIPGLRLLKEAVALFAETAAQMNKHQMDSLFDFPQNESILTKVVFPDNESRHKLSNGLFSQEEIFNLIIDCLPEYYVRIAPSMPPMARIHIGSIGSA